MVAVKCFQLYTSLPFVVSYVVYGWLQSNISLPSVVDYIVDGSGSNSIPAYCLLYTTYSLWEQFQPNTGLPFLYVSVYHLL